MYRAPVEEIAFTLKHVAGLKPALDAGLFGDLSEDLVDAILAEAGRFATEEIAPLVQDRRRSRRSPEGRRRSPCRRAGRTSTAAGPKAAGTRCPGRRSLAARACRRCSASPRSKCGTPARWPSRIGPTLTMGAVEALDKHASEALKQTYLAKLVSGEWMGTMNLTEPQAGSDLNALRTRAEPAGDGTYRIFGQKIFITYGEHDFTENIVHLVLARLPDAPAGTRGISLFLVPKFLVDEDGRPRRAQRRLLLGSRAQARHPRLADLHHDLWRRLCAGLPRRARSAGSSARRTAASPACSP